MCQHLEKYIDAKVKARNWLATITELQNLERKQLQKVILAYHYKNMVIVNDSMNPRIELTIN